MDGGIFCPKHRSQDHSWEAGNGIYFMFWSPSTDCKLFRNMCQLLDKEHKMSTVFHPQGNSRVERMVTVVGNLIAIFCCMYREWDKNLPLQTLAYRSTVQEVKGFPHNFIMTRWEIALPLDIMLGTFQDGKKTTAPEYVQTLLSRLGTCFEDVRKHLKKVRKGRKLDENKFVPSFSLSGGDYTLLWRDLARCIISWQHWKCQSSFTLIYWSCAMSQNPSLWI